MVAHVILDQSDEGAVRFCARNAAVVLGRHKPAFQVEYVAVRRTAWGTERLHAIGRVPTLQLVGRDVAEYQISAVLIDPDRTLDKHQAGCELGDGGIGRQQLAESSFLDHGEHFRVDRRVGRLGNLGNLIGRRGATERK